MKFDRKIIPDTKSKQNFITKKRLREEEINFEKLRAYRLDRVKKELEKNNIEACILFDPVNVRYSLDTVNMSGRAMDTLSHYLVHNIYMYRVKVRFLHNGNKYVWNFDLGVDKQTNMIIMYHGMPDKSQQQITAYRDIDPDTDTDVRDIRNHKDTQKNRSSRSRSRSRKRISSNIAKRVSMRRGRMRINNMMYRNRNTRRRFFNQYRY